jgi:hypothetical protein
MISHPQIQQSTLATMEVRDRELLLEARHEERLGIIIQLNREARYNNSLNAILLMAALEEMSSGRAILSESRH